jgi:hypothetical protein
MRDDEGRAGAFGGRRVRSTVTEHMDDNIKREVSKRRTFAIISHPDAGRRR